MVISQSFVGKEYPIVSYKIGREKLREFLVAIKADLEKFSELIHPTFSVVFQHEILRNVLFDPELKLNLSKLVHGEQEFIYHKPVVVGDTINTIARIEKIFQKGTHDFVVLRSTSYNQVQEKVLESIWTFVMRGGNDTDFSLKEKIAMKIMSYLPSDPKIKKLQMESLKKLEIMADKIIDLGRAQQDLVYFDHNAKDESAMQVFVDKYMPQVYAGASGDFNIIHLDSDFGKSVGLGGNILHGMATMALGANFVVHNLDPKKIKRYRVRFSAPVKPLDTLTYRGKWSEDRKIFNFKAVNQLGQEVLNSCVVELI
jgi:acyl dehydratase